MIPLEMTKAQAAMASHQGKCDDDVEALCRVPAIARQLAKIDPAKLASELSEYGDFSSTGAGAHLRGRCEFGVLHDGSGE